jgi:hypothetical protein
MVKDVSKAEGRKLLNRLAEHLDRQRYPGGRSLPWARKSAEAIRAFLAGTKSLDAAFGQRAGRGRPRSTLQHERIAIEGHKLYARGDKSWEKIFEENAERWAISDTRTLREIMTKHAGAYGRHLSKRIKTKDII